MKQGSCDVAEEEDDGRTYSSAASSIGPEEDAILHAPSLEDVKKGQAEFECILCHGIKRFSREKTWRRHVHEDLKSYVCTLGKGECSLEMFGDQKEWFEHEMQKHRQVWVCAICERGPFRLLAILRDHISAHHTELADTHMSALVNLSQSALDAIPAQECPFCDGWHQNLTQGMESADTVVTVTPNQFRRHVGSHLQQLALFAIPRAPESLDDGGSLSLDGEVLSTRDAFGQAQSSSNLSLDTVSLSDSAKATPPALPERHDSENNQDELQQEERIDHGELGHDAGPSAQETPRDIIILLLGVTGGGKSTFASHASGQNLSIGHNKPCTQDVEEITFKLDGHSIVLLDTPGFDDELRSDVNILRDVGKWMANRGDLVGRLVDGLILLHPLTVQRIWDAERKQVALLQKLLGENSHERIIIATTMGEQIKPEMNAERLERRQPEQWRGLIGGAIIMSHQNNQESAHRIIRKIIEMTMKHRSLDPLLHLERELDPRVIVTVAGKTRKEQLESEIKLIYATLEQHDKKTPTPGSMERPVVPTREVARTEDMG